MLATDSRRKNGLDGIFWGLENSEVGAMPHWDWAGSDDGPELWAGSGLSPKRIGLGLLNRYTV